MNDGPGFHSNMPVSELTEHDTRAIEASVVSLAPLIVETEDGVTHETRPTPTKPHGARGLEGLGCLILDRKTVGQRPKGLRLPRVEQRAKGENTDGP